MQGSYSLEFGTGFFKGLVLALFVPEKLKFSFKPRIAEGQIIAKKSMT
jgi:hypothetical protein